MKQELEIIKYDASKGIPLSWENNLAIEVKFESNEILISANNEGLIYPK